MYSVVEWFLVKMRTYAPQSVAGICVSLSASFLGMVEESQSIHL